jgi:hypothetical protein
MHWTCVWNGQMAEALVSGEIFGNLHLPAISKYAAMVSTVPSANTNNF